MPDRFLSGISFFRKLCYTGENNPSEVHMNRFFCAMLAAALLLCGCGASGHSPSASSPAASSQASSSAAPPSEVPPPPQKPLVIDTKKDTVEQILSEMTLPEKVGQLFFVRCPAEDAVAHISTYHLGGYILFGRDTKDKTANDLVQTIHRYQEAAAQDTGVPLLIGVDEEGGSVVRVSSNPHIRSSKFLSPQALYRVGGMEAIGADTHEKDIVLKSLGIHVNLAPVADVSTNPADFIYSRTFGQNAAETAEYTAAVTARMAEDGIGSVLKHFPGYGNNVDTHTGIAIDTRPLETFMQQDFLPFSSGIAAGGDTVAVMVSHNIVESMDDQLPASLSPAVHQILREELGFRGVVMTDDLAMDAVSAYAEGGSSAVMAIAAGNDLVLTTDYPTQIPKVIAAVQNGTLSQTQIDDACLRVLRWKEALGLIG